MQRPINQEIRHYEESVFMGLSLRQTLWSAAAVTAAVVIYLLAGELLGKETVSWVCVVAAAPFAFMGFFTYDGLNAGQFLKALVSVELRKNNPRIWKNENRYRKGRQN